ncbi:short-chain dehydrogenase/reductase [Mycolicibacterium setense]|uniref:short-chain dehydrogenase/reductase n=1 Tax=Mycolicibacterium setense TaxID=431269 RepID=UPI0009E5D929|nr:short-chain dehydrogenase/reductase [Mycolicibacterium setense]
MFTRSRRDWFRASERVTKALADQVAVITGGAQGIGAQVARQLVDSGARVVVLDRDIDTARRLVAELGCNAAAFEADVTSAESMNAACAAAAERFGSIDVVIANAGIAGPGATIAAVDAAQWRQVVDVNLTGVFNTVRAALPFVRKRRGYIMVVASIGAVLPGPTVSAYMASKAGVESLTRSLRIEMSVAGVDIGIAYFGLVGTALAEHLLSRSGLGAVMAALPGRAGKPVPVEVAAAAITFGIARRARRVYAPRWVRIMLDLRPLLFVGDRLLAASPRVRQVVLDADRAADTGARFDGLRA